MLKLCWLLALLGLTAVACKSPDLTVGVPESELQTTDAPTTSTAAPPPPVSPPAPEQVTTTSAPTTLTTLNAPDPPPVPPEEETAPPPPPDEGETAPSTSVPAPPAGDPPLEVPGLTSETMKLGVVVDDKTGEVADGRSTSAFLAVLAWAESVNAGGGLAGRRVRVGLIDAGLFGHAEALRQVCDGDFFALVGSDALFDQEGLEQLEDPECGLSDFPARANSPRRASSSVSFFSVPIPAGVVETGAMRMLADRYPDASESAASIFVNFPATVVATEQVFEAALGLGYTFRYEPTVEFDADFAEPVRILSVLEVSSLIWAGDAFRLADLLKAAEAEGLGLRVSCASACHGRRFTELLAEAVSESLDDDQSAVTTSEIWTWSPYLPPGEEDYSSELTAYRQWLQEVEAGAEPDIRGVAAWSAARLFEEAVMRAVGGGTPSEDFDLLTPETLAEAASVIVNWNGRGLHGVTHPGRGVGTPCGIVLSVTRAGWERVHPAEPGTFDCSAENLFELETTAGLGLGLEGEDVGEGTEDEGSDGSEEPEETPGGSEEARRLETTSPTGNL